MHDLREFPPFRPFPGLGNGALMTAAGALPRRLSRPLARALQPRVMQGEDGNRVLADTHFQPGGPAPCVLLAHGLVGSNDSPYVVGTAAKAFARGFHVVRLNARNCGGTEALAADAYHGGMTGDLRCVAEQLARRPDVTRIYLIGFSLGGNMALKLAAEYGDAPPDWLAGVATLSPCLDFGAAADAMNASAFGRLCQRRFLVGLHAILRRRTALHDPTLDLSAFRGVRTIREFDDRYTAPLSGFRDVEHYYREASAARLMSAVRVPSLLVAAEDDPLVPFETLRARAITDNRYLRVLGTARGGHVAFLGRDRARTGDFVDADRRWGENRLVQFCAGVEAQG